MQIFILRQNVLQKKESKLLEQNARDAGGKSTQLSTTFQST